MKLCYYYGMVLLQEYHLAWKKAIVDKTPLITEHRLTQTRGTRPGCKSASDTEEQNP